MLTFSEKYDSIQSVGMWLFQHLMLKGSHSNIREVEITANKGKNYEI